MKSLIGTLLLFVLFTPAFAGHVDFMAFDNGDGTLTISYIATGGDIGTMALNVNADGDIDSVAVDSYFDVFPDVAFRDPDVIVIDPDTPIAHQDMAGEKPLPSNSFCISMAHFEGIATANEIVLTLNEIINFTLDINALRNGVLDTDGNIMTTNLPLIVQNDPVVCVPPGDEEDWIMVGRPESWCVGTQCYGDADGAREPFGRCTVQIGMVDINILISGFRKPITDANFTTWIGADFDRRAESFGRRSVRVGMRDLDIVVANFRKPGIPTDCND